MLKSEDDEKLSNRKGFEYLKSSIASAISADIQSKIDALVHEVSSLKDIEKLLFCLLMPVESSLGTSASNFGFTSDESVLPSHGFDLNTFGIDIFTPGGPSALHLSNQMEQSQAYAWIMSHLEEDVSTCLRKDEVYEDYRVYCDKHHMKFLNTADFGKVMKRAFPNVKPRRLGQRGQSRYCYGGMRKKLEVQPPFLPDITEEALGSVMGRSTTSPGGSHSSSGASNMDGGGQRRVTSTSPLTRFLCTNGGGTNEAASSRDWVDDTAVRTALGVRGAIVADVSQVLLEYAQQVFGVPFHSLFQLAQHLVLNRYVNARSRHAFALIAHAATVARDPPASQSPPPSVALAEALQKASTRSAFDRVGNGRTKSLVKAEEEQVVKAASNSPLTVDNMTRASARHNFRDNSPSMQQQQGNLYRPCSTNSLQTSSTTCAAARGSCSTPTSAATQYPRPYRPNFSPQQQQQCSGAARGGNSMYSAAALASPSLGQQQMSAQYQFPTCQTTTVAALAAAARQQQQLSLTTYPGAANANMSNYSSPSSVRGGSVPAGGESPVQVHHHQQQVQHSSLTPPVAHKEKMARFPGPSTPDAATAAYQRSGQSAYLSPVNNNNSTLYSAHQQQNSPYQTAGLHQTPAPLPPGVGARSPYIPTGNPPTAGSDLNHTGGGAASGVGGGMKRTGLPPHPVEAPGAYEPSPRFHLGGQSPNKRARYLSSASNSSVSTGSSVAVDALVGAANRNGVESYLEHSSNFGHSTGSRALHGTSPNGSHNNYSSSRSQSVMGAAAEHPVRMTSPFYPGHYEGLEMRSPAPPPVTTHGRSFPGNAPEQQQLPKPPAMVRAPLEPSVWTGSSNAGVSMRQPDSTVYNEASQRCPEYEPLSSSMHRVFRPPITPFSLDLENDDDDLTNLPRLGTSPGPQIPPSSPTEFLPFYSEAASKSAARQKQGQSTVTPPAGEDCCLTTASDGDTSTCSGLDRLDHPRTALSNASLETPPASALMMMHGTHDLHAADNNDLSPSSPGQSDDGSQDRTLTNFESQFDSVLGGRCSMPSGLANVPSPSDSNIIADDLTDKREQLQNELSTPGPAEPSESSPRRPDASTTTNNPAPPPASSAADVSITAF